MNVNASFGDDDNDASVVVRNLSGVNQSKKVGKLWLGAFPLVETSLIVQNPLFSHQINYFHSSESKILRVQQALICCYEFQSRLVVNMYRKAFFATCALLNTC